MPAKVKRSNLELITFLPPGYTAGMEDCLAGETLNPTWNQVTVRGWVLGSGGSKFCGFVGFRAYRV